MRRLLVKPIWGKRRCQGLCILQSRIKVDYINMRTVIEAKEQGIDRSTHLGEAAAPHDDHSSVDTRRGCEDMRTARKSKEKDTHQLIVDVAERLFRQIGFQKTTVADIARELHMSPANVYRFFAAKSEINEAVCMHLLARSRSGSGKDRNGSRNSSPKIAELDEFRRKDPLQAIYE